MNYQLASAILTKRPLEQYTDNLDYLSLDQQYLTLAMNPARGLDGTCQGDSGGGRLIYQRGGWVLVGLTSYGDQPCVAIDKNARLDTASSLEFLNEVLQTIGNSPGTYACP